MKHLVSRASAVALVVAAALTAACSNNDPMAPRAASAVRTPAAGPVHSGYAVSWGRDSSGNGGSAGTASSGYAVSWGKDGGKGGNGSNPDGTMSSGYAVSWGKDGGPSAPNGQ